MTGVTGIRLLLSPGLNTHGFCKDAMSLRASNTRTMRSYMPKFSSHRQEIAYVLDPSTIAMDLCYFAFCTSRNLNNDYVAHIHLLCHYRRTTLLWGTQTNTHPANVDPTQHEIARIGPKKLSL